MMASRSFQAVTFQTNQSIREVAILQALHNLFERSSQFPLSVSTLGVHPHTPDSHQVVEVTPQCESPVQAMYG